MTRRKAENINPAKSLYRVEQAYFVVPCTIDTYGRKERGEIIPFLWVAEVVLLTLPRKPMHAYRKEKIGDSIPDA